MTKRMTNNRLSRLYRVLNSAKVIFFYAVGIAALPFGLAALVITWRISSGLYEDWRTPDITDQLIERNSGRFRDVVGGNRVCIFPLDSFVVAHMKNKLPGYASNRVRSPDSASRVWTVVNIDDELKAFKVHTARETVLSLLLPEYGDEQCPCGQYLRFSVHKVEKRHSLSVSGSIEHCDMIGLRGG